MKQLLFSTSNDEKFMTAQHACGNYAIRLEQQNVEVVEIQSEDPAAVAIDKAHKAFAAIAKPLVITDDSWSFSGLNGFPGVYMHSINTWFKPEDFLHLATTLTDRAVILTINLVYIDDTQYKLFTQNVSGQLLREAKGMSKHSSHTVITMDGDAGLSIAEAYAQAADKSSRTSAQIWREFAMWYNKQ